MKYIIDIFLCYLISGNGGFIWDIYTQRFYYN